MDLNMVCRQIYRDIGLVNIIIPKIIFNRIDLISAADNKIMKSKVTVLLHDMP